jgi:hypothetical protein
MSNFKRSNFQAHPSHLGYPSPWPCFTTNNKSKSKHNLSKSCYSKNSKSRSKHSLSNSRYVKNSNLRCVKLGLPVMPYSPTPIRPFSTTSSRKADPLSFLVGSFAIPYPSDLLLNPLSGTFISLIGMGSTLFFLTVSLSGFFAYNSEYALILQRLDNIFLLFESFILTEQQAIDTFITNFDNYTPETLAQLYFLLQEHITVRETLFDVLSSEFNNPQIELTEEPLVVRADWIFENFRLGGNNVMDLVRDIENRLNIPEEHRVPSFWFED